MAPYFGLDTQSMKSQQCPGSCITHIHLCQVERWLENVQIRWRFVIYGALRKSNSIFHSSASLLMWNSLKYLLIIDWRKPWQLHNCTEITKLLNWKNSSQIAGVCFFKSIFTIEFHFKKSTVSSRKFASHFPQRKKRNMVCVTHNCANSTCKSQWKEQKYVNNS